MEHATLSAEVRAVGDDTLEFTASTDHVDRAGDVVEQNWDLKAIRRNPVFLWGHRYGEPPVGKIVRIWTEAIEGKGGGGGKKPKKPGSKRTKIQVKFVPDDIYPFAGMIKRMFQEKFLNTVSVGFRPLLRRDMGEEERQELGMGAFGQWFQKSELLEVSAVPIPMNPNAVQNSIERGLFSDAASAESAPIWEPDREKVLAGCDWDSVARALDSITTEGGDEDEVDEQVACSVEGAEVEPAEEAEAKSDLALISEAIKDGFASVLRHLDDEKEATPEPVEEVPEEAQPEQEATEEEEVTEPPVKEDDQLGEADLESVLDELTDLESALT